VGKDEYLPDVNLVRMRHSPLAGGTSYGASPSGSSSPDFTMVPLFRLENW
jgi:hypothetical protein